MWWRFEAMEKNMNVALLSVATFFFLFLSQNSICGQSLPEGIFRIIELQVQNGGGNIESIVAYYENLMESPLDINSASERDLERIGFLSDFQIASIIDYRTEYGDIISPSELSVIDGFNANKVADLLPFICFGTQVDHNVKSHPSINQKLILRSKRKYAENTSSGIPYYLYSKYRLRYGNMIQGGFTLENDPCESKWPDFVSAHIYFKDISILKNKGFIIESGVLGDYSLRMGQGLALWNSFSLSGLGDPASAYKKETGIVPYTSSDEQKFFRGIGCTLRYGSKWRGSFFASGNLIDAKVDGENYFSLPEGGIHVTENELAARNKMTEHLFGWNLSYRMKSVKIGTTGALFSFNKSNRRRVSSYNKYSMYDGWWGNFSVDAYIVFRKLRLFSEVAVDYGGAMALIAGCVASIAHSGEVSALIRHYPIDYIAPHSGAYSSSSACANETGFLLSGKWLAGRKWELVSSVDFANHPGERFGIDTPSRVLKWRNQIDYFVNSQHSLSWRFNYGYCDYEDRSKINGRISYSYRDSSGFTAGCRAEISWNDKSRGVFPLGAMLLIECGYRSLTGKWEASLRGTIFHIDDWENRIYSYERDLPQTFSVPALYGRGASFYCLLRYKPLKWLDLILKVSEKIAKMQVNLTF